MLELTTMLTTGGDIPYGKHAGTLVTDLAWHWSGVASSVTDNDLYLTVCKGWQHAEKGAHEPGERVTIFIPEDKEQGYDEAVSRWLDTWHAEYTRPIHLWDSHERCHRPLNLDLLQQGWAWLPRRVKHAAKTPEGLGIPATVLLSVPVYDRTLYACLHGREPVGWQQELGPIESHRALTS